MTEISLREAKKQDFEFLYELHQQTLKEYIEQTWGWDDDWQRSHFQKNFDLTGKSIIQKGSMDIGCLQVVDEGDHLLLSYIALWPTYQDQGIGSKLIGEYWNGAGGCRKELY